MLGFDFDFDFWFVCKMDEHCILWAQPFSPFKRKEGEYASAEWTEVEKRWSCHLD